MLSHASPFLRPVLRLPLEVGGEAVPGDIREKALILRREDGREILLEPDDDQHGGVFRRPPKRYVVPFPETDLIPDDIAATVAAMPPRQRTWRQRGRQRQGMPAVPSVL